LTTLARWHRNISSATPDQTPPVLSTSASLKLKAHGQRRIGAILRQAAEQHGVAAQLLEVFNILAWPATFLPPASAGRPVQMRNCSGVTMTSSNFLVLPQFLGQSRP
jgi:hypothetical protein